MPKRSIRASAGSASASFPIMRCGRKAAFAARRCSTSGLPEARNLALRGGLRDIFRQVAAQRGLAVIHHGGEKNANGGDEKDEEDGRTTSANGRWRGGGLV